MGGYNLAEVLRGQLQDKPAPAIDRDIETITSEILQRKQDAGNAILDIGRLLIEAKEMLPHGEWLPWLECRVDFTDRTARKFMKLAREWTNRKALSDLGATKALTLLALPPEERETFMAENHIVNGEEKTVIDMTSRELEKAIRERDEARKAAAEAQAEAQTAEESRARMETDIAALKSIHQAAQEAEAQAREALAAAQAELEALREKPLEVAVETVVDQEAVNKARMEAIAEMRAKVDASEKKRKEAETALSEAKKQAEANAEILSRAEKAEAELAEVKRQLEAAGKAERDSAVNQNGDMALFNVLFTQTQKQVNQMRGLRRTLVQADKTLDEKLKAAILALADMVRGCAE